MDRATDRLAVEYRREAAGRTLRYGRVLSLVGVPALCFFAFQDAVLLGAAEFVPYRLLAFVPCLAFVAASSTEWRRNDRIMLVLHLTNLLGIMAMMTSLGIVVFVVPGYSIIHRTGIVSGYTAAVAIVFLLSGGVRKYLPLIFGVPFAALLVIATATGRLRGSDFAYFSNPAIAIVAVLALSMAQEKLQYKEFLMRQLARRRRVALEIELDTALDTNRDLELELGERRRLERELVERSSRDPLTGALNRRAGIELLESIVARADSGQGDQVITVCFIDIDNLKSINDRFGHDQGDRVIRTVSSETAAVLRRSDFVIRVGGDEFVLVLPGCDTYLAFDILSRVGEALETKRAAHEVNIPVRFSYGVAEYEPAGGGETVSTRERVERLLKAADIRMYAHKQSKRNDE
jgi:diguanylate cyclase (GGDEF)-like protein